MRVHTLYPMKCRFIRARAGPLKRAHTRTHTHKRENKTNITDRASSGRACTNSRQTLDGGAVELERHWRRPAALAPLSFQLLLAGGLVVLAEPFAGLCVAGTIGGDEMKLSTHNK